MPNIRLFEYIVTAVLYGLAGVMFLRFKSSLSRVITTVCTAVTIATAAMALLSINKIDKLGLSILNEDILWTASSTVLLIGGVVLIGWLIYLKRNGNHAE